MILPIILSRIIILIATSFCALTFFKMFNDPLCFRSIFYCGSKITFHFLNYWHRRNRTSEMIHIYIYTWRIRSNFIVDLSYYHLSWLTGAYSHPHLNRWGVPAKLNQPTLQKNFLLPLLLLVNILLWQGTVL